MKGDEGTTIRHAAGAVRFGMLDASVMEDPDISMRAKAVYALLVCFADRDRKGTPSRARMARSLGVSIDTVDRALGELRDHGVVTWVHRKGVTQTLLSSEYTLHHMGAPRAGGSRTGAPSRTAAATPSSHQREEGTRTGAATPTRTSASVTEPSTNRTIEQSAPPDGDAAGGDQLPGLEQPAQPSLPLVAQGLAGEWWERFTPRPTAPFVGQRKIILRLLEAGWQPEHIRSVLATEEPPLVLARVERRLRGSGSTIAGVHDWSKGDGGGWATR